MGDNTEQSRDWAGEVRSAVRDAVDRSGKRRADLASELGIAESTLYNWLSGKFEPSWADLGRLAEKTGHPITITFDAAGEPGTVDPDEDLRARLQRLEAMVAIQGDRTRKALRGEASVLMTRSEAQELIRTAEERVTAAIEENRRITRQAIVGDEAMEEALVEILTEELRPVFEGMAAQFRATVEQLLDARLGASGSVE